MGISLTTTRRRNYPYHPHHPPPPYAPPPPPPPPPTYYYPTTDHHHPYPIYPPPLPPPPHYNYPTPPMGRFHHHSYQYHHPPHHHPPPHYPNQCSGGGGGNYWAHPVRPSLGVPTAVPLAAPGYVEHHNAKKVRNVVNVHKDTLKVFVDEDNPDQHLVSFVFDALHDGSITISYFAKEEAHCRFAPIFPEAFAPVKFSFQRGLAQKFSQPSGSGFDLGFFELDDLSKPSPGEDVFPLVICAETCLPHLVDDFNFDQAAYTSSHMQITQAVLEKNDDDLFQVRVIRQILWVDGVRYELREIYGLGSSSAAGYNDNGSGKECVICMTEPKDTAILPCRHMCLCSECAKELRVQSNKCPICRQPIEELIEIKIDTVS